MNYSSSYCFGYVPQINLRKGLGIGINKRFNLEILGKTVEGEVNSAFEKLDISIRQCGKQATLERLGAKYTLLEGNLHLGDLSFISYSSPGAESGRVKFGKTLRYQYNHGVGIDIFLRTLKTRPSCENELIAAFHSAISRELARQDEINLINLRLDDFSIIVDRLRKVPDFGI